MILLALFLAYAVALAIALGRAGFRSRPASSQGGPRPEPRHVLIVGATGGTGRELVAQALERGTRNILRAMKAHGARRLVCETSLGLGDSAGRLGLVYTLFIVPLILPLYFWDKTRQERAIAGSGVEWVIVRPGALNNGDKRGRLQRGREVGSLLWTVRISRADVAAFMLSQLRSDMYLGSAPGVCW